MDGALHLQRTASLSSSCAFAKRASAACFAALSAAARACLARPLAAARPLATARRNDRPFADAGSAPKPRYSRAYMP